MRELDDRHDPLVGLVVDHRISPPRRYEDGRFLQGMLDWFDGLEKVLRTPPGKKIEWFDAGWAPSTSMILSVGELARAQDLFRRAVTRPGYGKTEVESALLFHIAMNSNSASVPFWTELLDLQIGRDSMSKKRKSFALAALAFTALVKGVVEAWSALATATRHSNADVRTAATYFLGEACLQADDPVAEEVQEALEERARSDRSFGPRFLARLVLRELGQPVPFDNPDGVVAFQVTHIHHRDAHRVIEAMPRNTLDDLHFAIQEAFGWGADHPYAFFLKNKRLDYRFTFDCPGTESEHRRTDLVHVGDMGLRRGHKLTYFFDYGDCHQFEVVVEAVKGQRDEGEYPRLVESVGEAMRQHPVVDGWDEQRG